MANKVLFKTGTAAAFKNLTTKTAGQIYFVPQTDSSPLSGEIYFDYDANTRIIMGNTTGSLNDTSNKIYLVGATAQQNAAYTVSNSQVYMMGGTLTANVFSGKWGGTKNDIGASNQPIYLSSGTFTASNSTIGSTDTPIYMKNGVLTSTGKKFSNYLPLVGGTLTGNLYFKNTTNTTMSGATPLGIYGQVGDNDSWRIVGGGASDAGYLEIATCNDGSEPIYVRQYGGGGSWNGYNTQARTATLLDASGNTSFPGALTANALTSRTTLTVSGTATFNGSIIGDLTGNADTASYPEGFGSRSKSWTWGTLTTANGYTQITNWHTANGSDIGFAEKGGALSVQIDGNFYQGDGKNLVLDSSNYKNYAPTKTGSGASGTWGISITGNAATATTASKVSKKLIVDEKEFNGSSEVEVGNTVNYYVVTGETGKSASGKYYPALWKCSTDLTIRDGLIVSFKMPTAGHDYGCMLSIDGGTTYHPISQTSQYNGSRLTTHYSNGSTLFLVYSSTWVTNSIFPAEGATSRSNITGSWIVLNGYNTDTLETYTDYAGETTGTTGLWANSILMRTSDGRWSSIVTSSSTATTHTKSSELFMLGSKIWWTPNTVGANIALHKSYRSIYSFRRRIDFRYSSNCGTTLTAGKPVYLVGKVNSGYFALDDTWWTQTLPTSDDGKVYVLVGGAYNTYMVDLYENNEWYWFKGGSVRPYGGSGGKITFGDVDNPLYTYDGTNNINIPLYDGTTA